MLQSSFTLECNYAEPTCTTGVGTARCAFDCCGKLHATPSTDLETAHYKLFAHTWEGGLQKNTT